MHFYLCVDLNADFVINICIAFNYLKRGPEIEAANLPVQAVLPKGFLFTHTNCKGDDISIQYVQPPLSHMWVEVIGLKQTTTKQAHVYDVFIYKQASQEARG